MTAMKNEARQMGKSFFTAYQLGQWILANPGKPFAIIKDGATLSYLPRDMEKGDELALVYVSEEVPGNG